MQIAIGQYEIINTADTIVVFAMQIGVTRIGSGGRCMPRTRRGAMASVLNLVASLIDPETLETETRPVVKTVQKIARAGRAVVALAILVVGLTAKLAIQWTKIIIGIGRILYCALVGRTGRIGHAKQPWRDVYANGAALSW